MKHEPIIVFIDNTLQHIFKSVDALKKIYHQTFAFNNQAEGLDYVQTHPTDILLVNLDLAPNDAVTLTKELIHSKPIHLPFIVVYSDKQDDFVYELAFNSGAEKAKRAGTAIIVTNPSPIRWGGPESKTDDQLRVQAAALEKLGRQLDTMGLQLAYHNHDAELRNAAREFHHMMVGTDPKYVTLCLDAHWIYRGSGNSSVALFDILEMYGPRVTELHLRQSVNQVWTEAFGDGDIDYRALARHLLAIGLKPHLVLEQAVEQGSPHTMDPVEAHRRSSEYAREVFAAFATA